MGTEYTVIMQDEFNWDYIGRSKSDFIIDLGRLFFERGVPQPNQVGAWYGGLAFDFGRAHPLCEPYQGFLMKHCDAVYVQRDNGSGLERIL